MSLAYVAMTSIDARMLETRSARQRETWKAFVHAMGLITGVDHA